MTISQSAACRRLSMLGLPKETVHQILNLVDRWKTESGEEWTVNRLKSLKTYYLQQLAGVPEPKLDWVSKRNGKIKGPFGSLMTAKSGKGITRCLNALMVYSGFTANKVTPTQWNKFHSSVVSPAPSDPDIEKSIISMVPATGLPLYRGKPTPLTFQDMIFGESRVPLRKGGVPESQVSDWLPDQTFRPTVMQLITANPLPFAGIYSLLSSLASSPKGHEAKLASVYFARELSNVGRIGFIQESGYKLRAVANPNRVLQLGLEPLKRAIWTLLRGTDRDFTYAQHKGVEAVQGWLKAGSKVYSVDLSDATNNFPLSLQLMLLEKLLPAPEWLPYIKLFGEVSRSPWQCRLPDGRETSIRWTKGQPLGLGPSFGSFALTHHAVVRLCGLTGKSRDPDFDYCLLGDDVVIKGERSYVRYRKALESMGCPVSEAKTISSDRLAEFAGRVITPSHIIPTAKWREPNDRSFLDLAKALGPKSVPLFKTQQRKVITFLAGLPTPSVYKVEGIEGLGWNPQGIPLKDRLSRLLEIESLMRVKDDGITYRLVGTKNTNLGISESLGVRVNPQTYYDPKLPPSRPEKVTNDWAESLIGILNTIRPETVVVSEDVKLYPTYRPDHRVSDPRGLTTLDRYLNLLSRVSGHGMKVDGHER
jgi:hypothetical protein